MGGLNLDCCLWVVTGAHGGLGGVGVGERGALGGIKVDQPGHFFSLLGQRKDTMSSNTDVSAFAGDGRPNYSAAQWRNLYLSASESGYMAGFSFPGFTVIGDSVFLLATRLSALKKQRCPYDKVAHFLCTVRRPLCWFLVYLSEHGLLVANHRVYHYAYAEPLAVFAGDSDLWAICPLWTGSA